MVVEVVSGCLDWCCLFSEVLGLGGEGALWGEAGEGGREGGREGKG